MVLKYFSEKLNKLFDTEEELHKAEAEVEQKELEKLQLAEKRKERAKEVESALKEAKNAQKHYIELLNAFCKDYGYFHYSWNSKDGSPLNLKDFIDLF